jgi:ubiquinone/menaquinone biosynthesis C-methylase UbiE
MNPSSAGGERMTELHRDYFNRLAPEWDRMMPCEKRLMDWFVQFGVAKGDRVLDVGAGTGRVTEALSELTGPMGIVFVTDLAEDMIAIAKIRLAGPGRVFACSDAHRLPIRSACLDKIVCYSAFPHFQDKSHVLREMRQVLKPGGKLLILHSTSHGQLNAFHASLEGPVRNDQLPSLEDMKALLEIAGFNVLSAAEAEDLYWIEAERMEET